ncbi:MAG: glycosyltransferase family 4 protein [Planctomycetota bacterium]|nr:glycosyltransferase family 4 protein [Planctomycetota bacterium]
MTGRRLRILVLTVTCDGTDVGEAWSSYQWVSRLAKHHDLTVLTCRTRERPSAKTQLEGIRVIEWPDIAMPRWLDQLNRMLKPGYIRFYINATRWIRNAVLAGERFDLIHQISPLAIRFPSPAIGFNVPLVLGPLAGSLEMPKGFNHEFGYEPWYTRLRVLDRFRLKYDPMLRRTLQQAQVVLGAAPYVRELLDGIPLRRFEVMSETGVVQLPEPGAADKAHARGLHLLFVGRVIRSKGVRDAVRAIAKVTDLQDVTLDVVGDGEDRAACEAEARQMRVTDRVVFHGRIPRQLVDTFYARSHAFLFPSMREPSGNAVLEAMSHGLAMIVASTGGPAFSVDDDSGIRVTPVNPEQYASDLAASIRALALNPALVAQMGCAARRRIAEHFLWDRKVQWMLNLYDSVVGQQAPSGQSLIQTA